MANKINYRIVIDTREKDLSYKESLDKLIDKRRRKDGTKYLGTKIECVKPLNCKNSVGDLTYEWQYDGDDTWNKTSFSIEIKRKLDLYSSISTKASFDRLMREFSRGSDNEVEMKFIHDLDLGRMVEEIKKLEGNGFKRGKLRANSHVLFIERYNKLLDELYKRNIKCYCSGRDMSFLIRRLVKDDLKKTAK